MIQSLVSGPEGGFTLRVSQYYFIERTSNVGIPFTKCTGVREHLPIVVELVKMYFLWFSKCGMVDGMPR